jgi:hypothetical protein
MKTNSLPESQVYLSFIKANALLLTVPLLLGCMGGWIHSTSQPLTYASNMLLQMDYTESNLKERIIVTDQATTILRSGQIHSQIQLNPDNKMVIYKSGPVAISVSAEGLNKESLVTDVMKIKDYGQSHYPLTQVAEIITSPKSRETEKEIFIGASIGVFLGFVLSLIRTYLKNF